VILHIIESTLERRIKGDEFHMEKGVKVDFEVLTIDLMTADGDMLLVS
jgi:hypothetical protein